MSLIAWYPLNGDLKDYSGNENNMIIDKNISVDSNGKIGKCYYANENEGYMTSTKEVSLGNKHTYSFWVFPMGRGNNPGDNSYATGAVSNLSHGTINYNTSARMVLQSDNTFKVSVAAGLGSSRPTVLTSTETVPNSVWSHVAVTIDNRVIRIYINGKLSISGSTSSDIYYKPVKLTLFRWATSYSKYVLTGKLNDVRVYDEVLSPKEIKEISMAKVLHYDCNMPKESTVNLASSGIGYYSPYHDMVSINTGLKFTMKDANKYIVINKSGFNPKGKTLTLSGIIKKNGSPILFPSSTATTYQPAATSIKKEPNGYFEVVQTYPNESSWLMHFSAGNNIVGDVYTFENFMIEEKDHATEYVNGQVLAKVTDSSGFGNHSEAMPLDTCPRWQNTSCYGTGSYLLDGTKEIKHRNPFLGQDKLKQEWTVCSWVKIKSDSPASSNLNNFNSGNRLIQSTTPLLYLNSGTHDYYSYGKQVLNKDQWIHVAYVFRNSDALRRIYMNGVDVTSSPGPNKTSTPSGIPDIVTVGSNLKGEIADYRIYATALSAEDIKLLFESRASVTDTGKLLINDMIIDNNQTTAKIDQTGTLKAKDLIQVNYKPGLVDYSVWTVSSAPGWSNNGSSAENGRIVYSNPLGDKDMMWYSPSNDATSDGDGGFNSPQCTIDKTKKYRFSIWLRREKVGSGSGTTYFGLYSYNSAGTNTGVLPLSSTTPNTNAYFTSFGYTGFNSALVDKWALLVAYVHPNAYTGSTDATSGVYDITGKKLGSLGDFKWNTDSAKATIRSYLYYSTKTDEKQYFYRPRIDLCDGSEPSLRELTSCIEHLPLTDENGVYYAQNKFSIKGDVITATDFINN